MRGPFLIEFDSVFPPYDDAFIDALHTLGRIVFGEIDREDYFSFHMNQMPDASVRIARTDQIIGFKMGFAMNPTRYYSALGGVHPEHRRSGIALQLMNDQHAWAKARGYRSIETGVINTNNAMLSLNIRAGFKVIGTYCRKDEPRAMMLKEFVD
jgi:predicted GNAT superfamily acetyltransferase